MGIARFFACFLDYSLELYYFIVATINTAYPLTYPALYAIIVVTMFVDSCTYSRGDRSYTRHLLRTSFREDGKVKHKTIANISNLPLEEIQILKSALSKGRRKGKKRAAADPVVSVSPEDMSAAVIEPHAKFGPLYALNELARRLGFHSALGGGRTARLSLWLVYARLLGYESRLGASRAARGHSVESVLGPGGFDEDDLYEALDWLEENQERIEDRLNSGVGGEKSQCIFLYDVTSSYLEGTHNELAAFGYNRDGKRGKMQIVIGLLTDADGDPLTVEVFDGNTCDTTTCTKKIDEIKRRFGADRIVLVGDRGMIKQPQIDRIHGQDGSDRNNDDGYNDGNNAEDADTGAGVAPFDAGFSYITAITKPQIEKMIERGILQMDLFDEELHEIVDDGVRYILRRNPTRAEEIAATRAAKTAKIKETAAARNKYLKEHPRAKEDVALRITREWITKLKADKWISASAADRRIRITIDKDALAELAKLDGCYVIKTDIKEKEILSTDKVHELYKDLAYVEWAWRSFKTDLDNRPIFVRKSNRTRAHVFTVMLAYKLLRALRLQIGPHIKDILKLLFGGPCPAKQTLSHKDILDELGFIVESSIEIAGVSIPKITQPRPAGAKILEILDIKLPTPSAPTRKVSTTPKRTHK